MKNSGEIAKDEAEDEENSANEQVLRTKRLSMPLLYQMNLNKVLFKIFHN